MRRFLIWLSGARTDVLARTPGDRAKFEGIGAAILFTATLAGVSMTFALNTALNVFLPLAILAGAAWSTAIMQLDRWLVVSIHRRDKQWQNLYTAVPRLMLALLFGVVISTPLVLQIFRPEIEAKVVEIRQHDADAFRRQQQTGSVGTTVTRLAAQRDALQKTIQSGGDAPQNPEADLKIIGLRSRFAQAQAATSKAYEEWQCQLYGPCKPTGNGPLAEAAEREYRTAQRQVDKINGQVEDRKTQLTSNDESSRAQRVSDAKAALPQVESQLKTYTDQQQALQKTFDAKNRGNAGLLMRLKALDQVSQENGTLNTARLLLLLLLITTIECLPIVVKLLLTFGPATSYDKVLAKVEEKDEKAVEASLSIGPRKAHGDVDFEGALSRTRSGLAILSQIIRRRQMAIIPAEEISVSIYLDTDDADLIRGVERSVEGLVDLLGYVETGAYVTECGSFIRRFTARARVTLTAPEVASRLTKVERALELYAVDSKQAEVDAKAAKVITELMTALKDVPNACVRAGSTLIVKYEVNGKAVVLSRQLTQVEIRAWEKFPEIQLDPRNAIKALGMAVDDLDPPDVASALSHRL